MLARNRQRQEAERVEAQGQKQSQKPAYFPLSYKEGLSQWWAGVSPAVTEHRVLSFVPYLRAPPTHTHTGATFDCFMRFLIMLHHLYCRNFLSVCAASA